MPTFAIFLVTKKVKYQYINDLSYWKIKKEKKCDNSHRPAQRVNVNWIFIQKRIYDFPTWRKATWKAYPTRKIQGKTVGRCYILTKEENTCNLKLSFCLTSIRQSKKFINWVGWLISSFIPFRISIVAPPRRVHSSFPFLVAISLRFWDVMGSLLNSVCSVKYYLSIVSLGW